MEKIHENLPPIKLPFLTIFDGILVGILVIGVLLFVWQIWISKKKPQEVKKIKPIKFMPPVFSLSAEIRKLKQLQKKENWKMFALESTRVLKKILEKKFKKPFAFATGKELEEILQTKISAKDLQEIHQFFSLLDPVKFAQVSGKKEISQKILEILKMYK